MKKQWNVKLLLLICTDRIWLPTLINTRTAVRPIESPNFGTEPSFYVNKKLNLQVSTRNQGLDATSKREVKQLCRHPSLTKGLVGEAGKSGLTDLRTSKRIAASEPDTTKASTEQYIVWRAAASKWSGTEAESEVSSYHEDSHRDARCHLHSISISIISHCWRR